MEHPTGILFSTKQNIFFDTYPSQPNPVYLMEIKVRTYFVEYIDLLNY